MKNALVATVMLSIGASSSATIIAENTAGLSSNTFFPGNSLTTPSGGAWSEIVFNWFLDTPGVSPTAFGTLFLLTEEYLGPPDDLSAATSGFLAQSKSISSGMYFFDSALLLQPNTKYFFYADASGLLTGYSDVAGENVYFTFSGVSPFVASFADANYRLTGQVVQAIPEPSSLLLSGIGALGLIGYGWRSRRNNYV